MHHDTQLMSLDAVESRDAWGFVGVVRVGDHEAYRTLRSYPVPSEARAAAAQLLAHVLGALLAGQEGLAGQARASGDRADDDARRRDPGPRASSAQVNGGSRQARTAE